MDFPPLSLDMIYEDYNDFREFSPENIPHVVPNNYNIACLTTSMPQDHAVPLLNVPFGLPECNSGIGSVTHVLENQQLFPCDTEWLALATSTSNDPFVSIQPWESSVSAGSSSNCLAEDEVNSLACSEFHKLPTYIPSNLCLKPNIPFLPHFF